MAAPEWWVKRFAYPHAGQLELGERVMLVADGPCVLVVGLRVSDPGFAAALDRLRA